MATALLTSLETYAKPLFTEGASDIKILGTNWGFEGSVDAFCAKAKAAGYDGIEMWWQTDAKNRDELFAALKKHGLDIGFLCGSGNS